MSEVSLLFSNRRMEHCHKNSGTDSDWNVHVHVAQISNFKYDKSFSFSLCELGKKNEFLVILQISWRQIVSGKFSH